MEALIHLIPKQNARIHGLDTLRALAIVVVVIFHLQGVLPPAFAPIAGVGWMGVDLFFVLSGYLIGGQLLRPYARGERSRIKEFYRRRAYRILPAYWVVLLLYAGVPGWREWPGLAPAWKFLTFVENLSLNYPADLAFSHAWSLCVEEHFYLLLPVVLWAVMRSPAVWKTVVAVGALLMLGMGLRAWQAVEVIGAAGLSDEAARILYMKHVYYPTWTRLDGLLAGVAIAVAELFRPGWWAVAQRRANLLLASGLVFTGAAMWMFHGAYPDPYDTRAVVFGFPVLALGFGLVVAAAAGRGSVFAVRVPGARGLATLAFSLYLSHKAVAHVDRILFRWMEGEQSWRAASVYGITCLGFAWLLYAVVERPFLVLRDRSLPRGWRANSAVEVRTDPAL